MPDATGLPFVGSIPNWNKKPDYSEKLPSSNNAKEVPANNLITDKGPIQPHSPKPTKLSGVGLP